MPEATGRVASSARIAAVMALVQFHASSGVAISPMQFDSLPGSQTAMREDPAVPAPDNEPGGSALDRKRRTQGIESGEGLRQEQLPAHPAGDQTDDEFEPVFGGDCCKRPKSLHHLFIHSVPAARRIGQRPAAKLKQARPVLASGRKFQRLEVRPERKDPDRLNSRFRHPFEILTDNSLVPLTPHPHAGVRGQ